MALNIQCMTYFLHIHNKLTNYKWNQTINTESKIIYVKKGHINDCDEIIIELLDKKIFISIPLHNSNIIYKTYFINQFQAYNYISLHIENYEKKHKIYD